MNTPLVLDADAAALTRGVRLTPPSLTRCLLLAALLHLWLVALVGTAPGGSALPGVGLWSAIQIRLGGAGPVDSPGQAEAPLPYRGPVGRAPDPRFGGTAPDAPAQPSPDPGAAQLGAWNPRTVPSPPGRAAAPAQAPVDPTPATAPPAVLTRAQPQAAPRPDEAALPPAPAPTLPEPTPRPAPDVTPAPSTAPRLAPVDTLDAPVLERPAQSLRDIANPAPSPAAVARPQPAPAPQRDERTAAPTPLLPRPPAPPTRPVPLPDAAAPLAAPVPLTVPPTLPPTPAAPPAPVVPAAVPPPPARETPPPQPLRPPAPAPPIPPAPEAAAPTPAPPTFAVEPRAAPRVAPPSPLDVSQSQRVAAPDLALPAVRAAEPAAAPPAVPSPGPDTAVRDSLLPALPPVPRTGPRPGSDRAAPPAAAASAPALNLDLPRARAPLPGLATPRALNLVPAPPERKSTLSEGIEKAAKPDCRKAYAGLGVLAAVPLAADALRDGGCRW